MFFGVCSPEREVCVLKLTVRQMLRCALFAAILCICSPVAVYAGPIPFSLQTFAVMLCGTALPRKEALVSVLVYLLLSLCGLPLFSGGNSGLTAIPGPTGGYIWSFLLMIPVISLFLSIRVRHGSLEYLTAFAGCLAALLVCYLCGTLQYSLIAEIGFVQALSVCVLPFLLSDLIKALAAAGLGTMLRAFLKKQR